MATRSWGAVGIVFAVIGGIGVLLGVVALVGLLVFVSAVSPPSGDSPTPPEYEDERRIVGQAIEDARFVAPQSIDTFSTLCGTGVFGPPGSICGYKGRATFPGDVDEAALRAHLERQRWADNTPLGQNADGTFDYYREIGGRSVCLRSWVGAGHRYVETASDATCAAAIGTEQLRQHPWAQLVPTAIPARLGVHARLFVADSQAGKPAALILRFRASPAPGPPQIELTESGRQGLAEDCYHPRDSPTPLCMPVRTTPGGREIRQDGTTLVTAVDATVVRIDLTGVAGQPAANDEEVDAMVDSLTATPYADIVRTFANDQ